ncbi:MAG: hypothetical protein H6Q52_1066 [Deltaproteobacteria bacterium]|nr:hypothetical protein [Deltaproteobacteria bacterium]
MSFLFTQHWDIIPGREDEYANFLKETYIPQTTTETYYPAGGYYVEVGFGPRTIAVYVVEDLREFGDFMTGAKFKELTFQLKGYVYNYHSGLYEPTGNVKNEKYSIQRNVWKFNQYYDLRPGIKKEYADFIINDHIPALRDLDYLEITGGWNVLFGGFSEIIAEFTFKDPIDIGRLLNNEDFRRITMVLRNAYVLNYKSRIMRCTERFDEPKWFSL